MKKKIIIIITVVFLLVGSALFIAEQVNTKKAENQIVKDEQSVKAAELACNYTKMCINGKLTEEHLYNKLGELSDELYERVDQQETGSKEKLYCTKLACQVFSMKICCNAVMLGTKNYDDLKEELKELEELIELEKL